MPTTHHRSTDGTTLFTSSSENRVCTFVLPPDLLEPNQQPLHLKSHGTLVLPEPTSCIAPSPYWALDQPYTQIILTGSKDHPIQVHYAFPPSTDSDVTSNPSGPPPSQPPPLASYRLIKHETEAYMPVTSLVWPSPGTHFIAGTINRIALFDVSRPDAINSEPLLTISTVPLVRHRSKGKGNLFRMPGTISALAVQTRYEGDLGLIAAGTWNRSLGMYDIHRSGECIATWSVAGAASEEAIGEGNGIMQTVWSPCGRYLIANERCASGLMVYDVRNTHGLLACLTGRKVHTSQRLSCDVYESSAGSAGGGFEVWGGTGDGNVVIWEGVGNQEGQVKPSWGREVHQSAVAGTAMHGSGSILATCSGSWKFHDYEDSESDSDEEESSDSSAEFSSSDDSGSEASASQLTSKTPRIPMVVEETSLKVWNIRTGGSGSPEPERPSMVDEQAEA